MASTQVKNEPAKSGTGQSKPQIQPPAPESPPRPEANANEEMLCSIKEMMANQCTKIVSKFEAIISELVKKQVATALNPRQEEVSRQSEAISDLERSANEHSDQLTSMQDKMARLSATVQSLDKKCEELEAGSRWHNIRLVGLPEGSEGPRPTEFIAILLMDMLGLDEMPGLDRAHRTLRAKPKEGEPPRPIVIRVTQFHALDNALLCSTKRRECSFSRTLHRL